MISGMADFSTASGIPLPAAAGPSDVAPDLEERLGRPGEFPFTRGIHAGMYRTRPWTIRQLAGFATAADTNKRYRMLLDRGATGINGVFDYPSLRAVGSDDARAASDVGRGGVAVDVVDDFADLFAGIPLDEVSVSLVSSQPVGAAPHLAMFLAAAERRGFERACLAGTSQNDFLMETAITIAPEALPPASSFRVECDVAEFCIRELPRWNPISVTGYNYREAGADAPLELALTLAHGRAAARELIGRGLAPEAALPKISFILDAHADFFE
jgi:methylmalonyl-CoA mutase N-terminal domain/subunit